MPSPPRPGNSSSVSSSSGSTASAPSALSSRSTPKCSPNHSRSRLRLRRHQSACSSVSSSVDRMVDSSSCRRTGMRAPPTADGTDAASRSLDMFPTDPRGAATSRLSTPAHVKQRGGAGRPSAQGPVPFVQHSEVEQHDERRVQSAPVGKGVEVDIDMRVDRRRAHMSDEVVHEELGPSTSQRRDRQAEQRVRPGVKANPDRRRNGRLASLPSPALNNRAPMGSMCRR